MQKEEKKSTKNQYIENRLRNQVVKVQINKLKVTPIKLSIYGFFFLSLGLDLKHLNELIL